VMMVCLGNICRSPMAAAVLASKAQEITRMAIEVSSSGTSNWHVGEGANPASERTWEKAGYVHEHRASQITQERIADSDLVLVMDRSNLGNVIAMASDDQRRKIHLLRSFDATADHDEVPDPYGMPDASFEEVLEMLERAVDGLLSALGVADPSDTSR
jgi:protein-tyrosine phosphatase